MKKYIDRAALFNSLSGAKTVEEIFAAIQAAPAADVQEIRRGKWLPDEWITDRESVLRLVVKCSICGGQVDGLVDYCPYCGATMEEEEEA